MRAINLVPADDRQGGFNGGKSNGAFIGVLVGLFVLMIGTYVFSTSKAKETKAKNELATVQQSTDAYTQVANQYTSFQSAASAAEQRINTVQGLAKARFDWAGSLRDLARLVPSDVTIAQLGASVSTDSTTGGGSAFRGAIASPAITFTGCSFTQATVANLVTQLQAMRRVTNVTLEYSKQAVDGASGEQDGSTCNYYTFAMDVFFDGGSAQSAASVSPGQTAGGTLATETTTGQPVTSATAPAAGTATATTPAAAAAAATSTSTTSTTPTSGN